MMNDSARNAQALILHEAAILWKMNSGTPGQHPSFTEERIALIRATDETPIGVSSVNFHPPS